MAQAGAAQPRAAHGEAFQLPPNLSNFGGGSGQPLPGAVRQKMESFFKASFADVRVHVGAQASSVGALALTHGSNLYFAPGQYDPATARGQQLLGHELAHVVQQRAGRVRNPFGSGVAVVQDRGLEAEADRLGMRAAAHPAPAPPRTGSLQRRETEIDSRGTGAAQSGSSAETVQRRIYKYNEETKKWRRVEPGTRGHYRLPPDASRGAYFNTLTGISGTKIEDVRAGLSDLMMVTGSLNSLTKSAKPFWPKKLWKKLMAINSSLSFLGTITITGARKCTAEPYSKSPKGSKQLLIELWEEVLSRFLVSNGQWHYITRQSWFQNQEADIKIEVNFYRNRGYNTRLDFHKDTEGDNLFVNLLFNNDEAIPATEWIEDLAEPQAYKKLVMKTLMPNEMSGAINASRAAMNTGTHRPRARGTIRGGIAPKAAFVSWVDELVWHATPSTGHRTGTSEDYYVDQINAIKGQAVNWRMFYRGLAVLRKITTTQIARSFAEWKRIKPTARIEDFYEYYMKALNSDPAKARIHLEDVLENEERLKTAPISLKVGQDVDSPLFGTPTRELNAATGIKTGTPRRNSLTIISPDQVDMGARSFLRTWVRVVRRDIRYGPKSIDV